MTCSHTSCAQLQVALLQQHYGANQQHNIEVNVSAVRQAAKNGAKLIILPELHTSTYFCQDQRCENFDLATTIPGPLCDIFATVAKEEEIVLVTSLFERRTAGIYHNTAVVFDTDGSVAGIYRKMHIPDDPGYNEKFYFTPGDLGFKPIQTSIGKLGVLICWDQWYPEAARLMTLAGADLLIYPTAIGWDPADDAAEQKRQLDAWLTIQRSHAVANGIPVLSANRVGFEEDSSGRTAGAQFWGNSFITGPQGEFIAQGNDSDDSIVGAVIDLSRCEKVRRIWPFLRDRRIDAYAGLTSRWID